ncbi:MAG: acetyl-CoA decarbonylase/synthase complex subunit gamma [Chloroflexota bacterium]
MGLSGLEIYKQLPKTNCKECGMPTCLAFAMKLAAKQAELASCPYVSETAKQALDAASAPPIRLVTVGTGDNKVEVGNETVLFRHDKTFYHAPGIFVRVKDTDAADVVAAKAQAVAEYKVERVGMMMGASGLAIEQASGDAQKFAACVQAVAAISDQPVILISKDPVAMGAALPAVAERKPLIYAADKDNWQGMVELAKKYACPLAVYEPAGLSALASLSEQIGKAGVADLVLDPGARTPAENVAAFTQLRRLALRKNLRLVGFPLIGFPGEGAANAEEEMALAGQQIIKYGGFIVVDSFSPAQMYALLTLRLNIFTDPQKPIQVKPEVYAFGDVNASSPVLVTTNFSITYFSVAGEIEASGVPTYLVVSDSEGLSVLTAWAAGKFDSEKIAKSVKSLGIADKVSHRYLIIPGYVSTMSGEVEEELPGWKVLVGPREAVDIGPYLRRTWAGVIGKT